MDRQVENMEHEVYIYNILHKKLKNRKEQKFLFIHKNKKETRKRRTKKQTNTQKKNVR